MTVVWALPLTEGCCVPGSGDHFKPSGTQALCFRVLIRMMGIKGCHLTTQKLWVRGKGQVRVEKQEAAILPRLTAGPGAAGSPVRLAQGRFQATPGLLPSPSSRSLIPGATTGVVVGVGAQ